MLVTGREPGGPRQQAPDPRVSIVRQRRPGYGRACLAGIADLAGSPGTPADAVVFLGGDGLDDPDEIPRLLDALDRTPADLVVGSRVRGGAPGSSSLHPRWSSGPATGILRLRYGYRFTDIGPFRAIRWDALMRLDLRDPDFGWAAEMQVEAARAGFRAAEVPVRGRGRRGKRSRSALLARAVAGIKILVTCLLPGKTPARPPESPPPGRTAGDSRAGQGGR